MVKKCFAPLVLLCLLFLCLLCVVASISHGAGSMTNSWAVQVRSGGKEAADALASKYGFINLGLVRIMEGVEGARSSISFTCACVLQTLSPVSV